MINFATLQGLTIPEGVVTQIADASGRVLWAVQTGHDCAPIVLEVEKKTLSTYSGGTSYTDESFILLDIYPQTANSEVNVTYGGVTKTIKFSGTNAQSVFFGTFYGVADSVETPASGTLTIEGRYSGFACGAYTSDSKGTTEYCSCITAVSDMADATAIPANAFTECTKLKVLSLEGVRSIGNRAFFSCDAFTPVTIPASVEEIGDNPFPSRSIESCDISVDAANTRYAISGGCLIELESNCVVSGFKTSVIPDGVKIIGAEAFFGLSSLDAISFTIPASVTNIGYNAFGGAIGAFNLVLLPETPPVVDRDISSFSISAASVITVPKGCGEAYKAATGWSNYADLIVEAS